MLFYKDQAEYIAREQARLETLHQANIPDVGIISGLFDSNPAVDKRSNVVGYSVTRPVEQLMIDSQGIQGDRHRCRTRHASGREKTLYPRTAIIRQHRHLFLVSTHDCQMLSNQLGVDVTPELLGANVVIDRADGEAFSISELPAGTHLLVIPSDAKVAPKPPIATLVHYAKQQGCGITGNAIAHQYGDKSLTKAFKEASKNHRGIVCSVEYPTEAFASLAIGQKVVFKFSSATVP